MSIRLSQLDIPLGRVTATFLTHLHSTHIDDLQDPWSTGWLPQSWGSRVSPLVIYGPAGTKATTQALTTAFACDIKTRIADKKRPPSGIAFDAHDTVQGVAYAHNGVKVTVFDSHHGDLIHPNFGYIIEYGGKKVVISGDTTYEERVARKANGVDLLLHELADIDPLMCKSFPRIKEIKAHHSSPVDAGRIFSMARPKLAAFIHIVIFKANRPLDVQPTDVLSRTRSSYDGPLIIGEDLMRFEINDDVTVYNAQKQRIGSYTAPHQ